MIRELHAILYMNNVAHLLKCLFQQMLKKTLLEVYYGVLPAESELAIYGDTEGGRHYGWRTPAPVALSNTNIVSSD